MSIELGFHGAARTVTGSKYLLRVGDDSTLVDAGLFQGLKELRELNWEEPTFRPHGLSRVLLTHTHIDHIGYLPRLVRSGFDGPVLCTRATADLVALLLPDSARIQEEDADYANRKGFSRHQPALPLYTSRDAAAAIRLLEPIEYDTWIRVGQRSRARWQGAGHILGSASIELRIDGGGRNNTVLFSGDLSRYGSPLHPDPAPRPPCDVLIMESTYGDRDHETTPIAEQIAAPVIATWERGGTVLVPAFAVGRTQQLALVLCELMEDGRLSDMPIHIDSPMAVEATNIYGRYLDPDHVDDKLIGPGRRAMFARRIQLHRTVAESKQLNTLVGPRIILSASGMLVGGRVLHHLKRLLPESRNLVMLAGYQAEGTRGRDLQDGRPTIRVHGGDVPARAQCVALTGLSGHGDRGELLRWLRTDDSAPRRTFVTHGEASAALAFADLIQRELGWNATVPNLGDTVELTRL